MGRLKDDNFARGGGSPRLGGPFRPLLFVLLFLSVALMMLSRLDHGYVRLARLRLDELMRPVLMAATVPLEPFRRAARQISALAERQDELGRLRDENQKLRGWEWRARELERKLGELGRLAKVVDEPAISFSTARVIADSNGPFVRTVMLNGGREQGFRAGYPVLSADGLVGRIIDPGSKVARVLLLTDLNSRVPVLVGRAQLRAVLMGDNGPQPRLAYLPSEATVEPGDEVTTSGIGGLFPRGLRVGRVSQDSGSLRIDLNARLDQLEYVSILYYDTPASDLADDERAPVRPQPNRRAAVQPSEARP